LVPQECRPLYESLVDGGNMSVDPDAAGGDPVIRALIEAGLAETSVREDLQLAAVGPDAAFERTLTRWLDNTTRIQQEVANAYQQATVLQHRLLRAVNADSRAPCLLVVDRGQVTALHSSLTQAAEGQTCEWNTGPYGDTPPNQARPAAGFDLRYVRYIPPDSRLLRRGGSVRAVYDSEFLRNAPEAVERAHRDGEDVRVREQKLPMKLLIVDDRCALVPLGPYGHPALFVRAKPVVALLQRFFDLVWDGASPWAPTGAKSWTPQDPARSRRRVLELMAAGLKDEAIARQCGVSVRTVRRDIAQIMTELAARNRFEAGVAAVRLGWVSPRA
jgi:DNA-binding CsgD family transcriptional regulator